MASAARSGLGILCWHEPGVSLRSTHGCILFAASRLQNHQSPGISPSFRFQMQKAEMRPPLSGLSEMACVCAGKVTPPFRTEENGEWPLPNARRPSRAIDGNRNGATVAPPRCRSGRVGGGRGHAPLVAALSGRCAGVDLSTTAQMQQSLQTFSAVSIMSIIV